MAGIPMYILRSPECNLCLLVMVLQPDCPGPVSHADPWISLVSISVKHKKTSLAILISCKKKTWISEVTHEGLPSRLHSGRKTAEIHKACRGCWAGIIFQETIWAFHVDLNVYPTRVPSWYQDSGCEYLHLPNWSHSQLHVSDRTRILSQ